jgi:hypothetical protein
MNEIIKNERKPVIRDSKDPVYWKPFSIAAVLLVVVGLFRFSDSTDNNYFIYICLIAFALAALPWITSFRVNGLFEIERAIEKTKDETRERIDQTDKRFEDKLFSVRAELMASLTSIQSQVSQQAAFLNSTQSQISQQSTLQASRQSNSQIIAIGDIAKTLDAMGKTSEGGTLSQKQEIVKVETINRDTEIRIAQSDLEELKAGFAQSAAAALNDPLGLQCSKLIRQIPTSGLPMAKLDELQSSLEITDEQLQTLTKLKLILVPLPGSEQGEKVRVTNLGKIYSDYWKLSVDVSTWLKSISAALPVALPIVTPILASLWTSVLSKGKKE